MSPNGTKCEVPSGFCEFLYALGLLAVVERKVGLAKPERNVLNLELKEFSHKTSSLNLITQLICIKMKEIDKNLF